jgi:mRNA interferase RelE/StbE
VGRYRVLIRRSAEKEIARLPDAVRRRIVERILALTDAPRPHGCQKLSGEEKYRIRQGDRRIVHEIDDDAVVVLIVRVAHRSDVYR